MSAVGRKVFAARLARRLALPLCLLLLALPGAQATACAAEPEAAPSSPNVPADDEAGFVPIFNGRDLSGWVVEEIGRAHV